MPALAEVEPRAWSPPLPLAARPSPVSVSWPGPGYGNKAFTGREWDPETGLYYYRARYYDPKVGRFISEDPIGFDGGDVDLYAYVGNAPPNIGDPFGLTKGGKQNISVTHDGQTLTPKAPVPTIRKALLEAVQRSMSPAHIKALKALLKVAKRGGTMATIVTDAPTQEDFEDAVRIACELFPDACEAACELFPDACDEAKRACK